MGETKTKVDLIIPTYRGVNPQSFPVIHGMINYSKRFGLDVEVTPHHSTALVHRSRNMALTKVRQDTQFVCFLDDDMLPYEDALVRLTAHGAPVVGAYMTSRGELPPKIAAQEYDREQDRFAQLLRLKLDQVVRPPDGKHLTCGTGMLCIRKDTLDCALEYYLEARDWLDDNRRSLDRMHVRAEARERERIHRSALRKANFEREQYHMLFRYAVLDNEMEAGEDITFCRLLAHMGIEVLIDTSVIVGHLDWFPYSPANLEDRAADRMYLGSDMEQQEARIAEAMQQMQRAPEGTLVI